MMAPAKSELSVSSKSSLSSSSKKKIWIPEKHCQVGKDVVPVGATWVDDKTAISAELAEIVAVKAFGLRMLYTESALGEDEESLLTTLETYFGQVGFIAEGTWPTGRERANHTPCRMWTAKHNVTTEERDGILNEFKEAYIMIEGRAYAADFGAVLFDDIEKVHLAGCTSDYGIDMCSSSKRYTRKLFTDDTNMFQLASSKPVLGAKIGVSVVNMEDPRPKGMTAAAAAKAFGHEGDTVVHTGEISKLFDNYFLHNINTFEACSGCIVFLLDVGQPETVPPDDYGKAIAVHAAGYPHSSVFRNIAFLLNISGDN